MDSTGRITRNGGRTLDPNTGQYVYTSDVVYEGPCEFKQGGTQAANVESAGQLLTAQDSILKLPVKGTENVEAGDVWECTANPLDEALVGLKATLKPGGAQTFATSRRFVVEVIST